MAKICEVCGTNTIFYIWASSRYFNISKFMVIKNVSPKSKKDFMKEGHAVCFNCINKHNLMER